MNNVICLKEYQAGFGIVVFFSYNKGDNFNEVIYRKKNSLEVPLGWSHVPVRAYELDTFTASARPTREQNQVCKRSSPKADIFALQSGKLVNWQSRFLDVQELLNAKVCLPKQA